ncbi:MAG: DUF2240 family protein [Candidatus Poseidonia sp.]|nr:DUF2240 family protein [Poseidonia sp.]
MGDDVDDIRRALTIVFRGHEGIPQADVERMFSFDMEWVAPHEAEEVVDALQTAGWLTSKNGQLQLAVDLGEIDVPFGWFPRPSRLMRPVSAMAATSEPTAEAPPAPAIKRQTVVSSAGPIEGTAVSDDPRARLTKRVARFIARQSGLEMDELQRRAERKTRAFHLITPWMAYALVAREQGLVMDDIVQSLDVV